MEHAWRTAKLRDLGDIQAGRQRSPHFTKGRMRSYLRVANVFDGYIDTSDVLSMQFTDAEYDTYRLERGDILLNEGQSRELVGRSAMYRGDPPDCCFQNTLIRFRAGPDICPEFAIAIFQHYLYTGRFSAIASQTTSVAHLGVGRFADLEVPVPPTPEQRAIINALDVWNRALNLTHRLISAKQERKRALMQQLLTGKKRFPRFQHRWLPITFGEVFSTKKSRNSDSLVTNPITVGKYAIRPQREHFNRVVASDNLENYSIIEYGDFVYDPMSAYYGAFGRYELDEPGIVSPVYRVLHINPGYDPDFMKHLIKSHYIAYQLSANSSQGNRHGKRRTIQDEAFDSISFAIPRIDEQSAIATVLNACDREIELLQRKFALLKQQKQGLMQQLLTGKVRVPA